MSAQLGMHAGVLDLMLASPNADYTRPKALAKLLPPMTEATQAYKDRALAAGRTFEHIVRLEAAVRGW